MQAKALVVDDEPRIRNLLKRFLRSRGFKVVTARRGTEALTLFQTERPDVVLLDIIMPGMGGIEVLRRILHTTPRARVIMLTAVQDEEIGKAALRIGARDYIIKPFDLKCLERSIKVHAFLGREGRRNP